MRRPPTDPAAGLSSFRPNAIAKFTFDATDEGQVKPLYQDIPTLRIKPLAE